MSTCQYCDKARRYGELRQSVMSVVENSRPHLHDELSTVVSKDAMDRLAKALIQIQEYAIDDLRAEGWELRE